jgi:hypothetical protein
MDRSVRTPARSCSAPNVPPRQSLREALRSLSAFGAAGPPASCAGPGASTFAPQLGAGFGQTSTFSAHALCGAAPGRASSRLVRFLPARVARSASPRAAPQIASSCSTRGPCCAPVVRQSTPSSSGLSRSRADQDPQPHKLEIPADPPRLARAEGCPRQESNLRTRFRKPLLYPLSYGGSKRAEL